MSSLPRRRRDLDVTPRLPLPPGPVSNGEFVPGPASAADADLAGLMRTLTDDAARRVGLDRRRFLHTAGGVAASLAAINLAACAGRRRAVPSAAGPAPAATTGAPSRPGDSAGQAGGAYTVPPPTDEAACQSILGSQGELVVDTHTHHVMPSGPWRRSAPDTVGLVLGMLPAGCTSPDRLQCVNRATYLHDVFLASDTTVALLSDVPNSGPGDAPLPFADAVGTRQLAAQLTRGGAARVLLHNVIAPNVGALGATLDEMSAAAGTGAVAGFKVYTAWNPAGPGWSLTDPNIGLPVIGHAHDLGVRRFFAHKGLPLVHFDAAHNGPDDLVAVSRQFPDMDFVVFHGAWDPRRREGPFNPTATVGIDTLLAALDRHGVPRNDNVWVDLGTVWRQVLLDPDQAAHVLGKLLSRVGEDRVLWGTDAVWYGPPQAQLMAFRAFSISAAYQQRYGYPALTDERKRKILGLNAARLFGFDPTATWCALAADPLSAAKAEAAALRTDGALGPAWQPNGPTTRADVLSWLGQASGPWAP